MPEEKYVPNSSVMGGSSVARKVSFFGRDKIGAEKSTENTSPNNSDSPAPDSPAPERPAPGSPTPDSQITPIIASSALPDSLAEIDGRSASDSPDNGLPQYGRPRAVDGVHPECLTAPDSPAPDSPAPDRPAV